MNNQILIIDDDQDMCETLAKGLEARDFDVEWRTSAEEAIALVAERDFAVIVTDIKMPGLSGLQLCERLVANRPETLVVVITGFGSLDTAIAAIRAGAYDFLTKPFEFEQLAVALRRALKHREMSSEIHRLRKAVEESKGYGEIIGESAAMQTLYSHLSRIGSSAASVLIEGSSGTGKELVARALHRQSRPNGPFVAINCAAMPEALLESELFGHVKGAFTDAKNDRLGLFREADQGTLFLDEVGEMPLGLQAKLLRALQERVVRPVGGNREQAFETRIVAATNRDLQAAVADGDFREDLYFRLNVVGVTLPPLRSRGQDVLLLAQAFLERFATREGKLITSISQPAAEKLLGYKWPGNVRELENCMERAVTMARHDHLLVDDLAERVQAYQVSHIIGASEDPADLVTMEEVEERYIRRVLEMMAGNKSRAAKVLGFDRKTLYRRIERYGITFD